MRAWIASLSSESKESLREFLTKVSSLTKKDRESESFKDYARSFSMNLTDSYQRYCDEKKVFSFI